MSVTAENILEIYNNNPSSTLPNTALIYAGLSPYGVNSDTAIKFIDLLTQILSYQNLPWLTISAASYQLTTNTGYFINRPSLVMLTMPVSSNVGDIISITSINSGGFQIAQQDGMNILFGNKYTSTGAAGYLSSTLLGDCIDLRCAIPGSLWVVRNPQGNINVV
jgi:hypothetical protein